MEWFEPSVILFEFNYTTTDAFQNRFWGRPRDRTTVVATLDAVKLALDNLIRCHYCLFHDLFSGIRGSLEEQRRIHQFYDQVPVRYFQSILKSFHSFIAGSKNVELLKSSSE